MNTTQTQPLIAPRDIQPDRFPALRATLTIPDRFEAALADVASALEAGSIRNAVFNETKFTLSRIVNEGWKRHVHEPFLCGGKWKEQTQDVQDLLDDIRVYGLHDVFAASKKISKSVANGPAVDAMRAYLAEVLPLSQAVATLKNLVVKGRAPSAEPSKPVNPKKLVKTCPVCFRSIAVVSGSMAHHGYKRPGSGWQTSSCEGVRFQPLEVSSEGLEWLIRVLSERLAEVEALYAGRFARDSMDVLNRGKRVMETITKGSPTWPRHFQAFVSDLEFEMSGLKSELPKLNKRLAEWAPQ